ncbi:hypothetical protein [Mycoplasmopsis adleri]|uniref:hypothetical protein n=1 Tax=Mycoplasmopsis adleri TaxID=51362 RepID=UPI00387347AC
MSIEIPCLLSTYDNYTVKPRINEDDKHLKIYYERSYGTTSIQDIFISKLKKVYSDKKIYGKSNQYNWRLAFAHFLWDFHNAKSYYAICLNKDIVYIHAFFDESKFKSFKSYNSVLCSFNYSENE